MNNKTFIKELEKINIKLTLTQQSQLELYYNLLIEENKKYNLTAITDKEVVYLKHFYDSLTTTKIIDIKDQSVCDIGTGAGFPGIVLKIVFPNIKITLIDSTAKKCNFLKLVTSKLNLKDVIIINERIENYSKNNREKYDIVINRAVANLKILLEIGIPLLKINGDLIAMKGNITQDELSLKNYEEKLGISQNKIITFKLPFEESFRTLISFTKITKTNELYPRKYSEIKKKQL